LIAASPRRVAFRHHQPLVMMRLGHELPEHITGLMLAGIL
jgi:hypothetical protein